MLSSIITGYFEYATISLLLSNEQRSIDFILEGVSISLKFGTILCDRIWEKGALRAKRDFLSLFNLPPFQGSESLGLQTWFVNSLDLLLRRSNVRNLSKPPVPSGDPPKRGIKQRISNAIDVAARPAHTGSGRNPRFAVSVVGWWKNIHTRFKVHSCYGFRDISVFKHQNLGNARSAPFSQIRSYMYLCTHTYIVVYILMEENKLIRTIIVYVTGFGKTLRMGSARDSRNARF